MYPKTYIREDFHLRKAEFQVGLDVFLIDIRVIGTTSESLSELAKFGVKFTLTQIIERTLLYTCI